MPRRPAVITQADDPSCAPRAPLRLSSLSALRPIPRRLLSRVEAAIYAGVGETKFDQMVSDGRMPKARRIDGRKVWDIQHLDLAIDALPIDSSEPAGTSWDDA